jgi:ornithine--oxo-acid transaminase
MATEIAPGRTDAFLEEAERYGANNYKPLDVVIDRAEGVWVWDVDGRRYLDMLSAYSALNQGHRHPAIIRAAKAQLDRVTLTSRAFHNDQLGPFLRELCELAGYDKALPMNSGAEAVETAIKLVRKWGYECKGVPDGKAEIIVCRNNFHGRTTSIVGFSSEAQYRQGFGPFAPGFRAVPFGDADALAEAITENTVGVLFEPIQGEGGVIVPPDGWLQGVRDVCDDANALMVADEIQTGLGRTGRMFACEWEDVRADVLIVGKALGGGLYPVSAVLADADHMDVFRPGDHGSTFGGNPPAAAIGRASLRVLQDENLSGRADQLGRWFMGELQAIGSPHVAEVRGRGLLVGVEIKESSGTARPYCEALKERGILAKETHGQVIRFAPPLVIEQEVLEHALEDIAAVLQG